MKKTQIKVKVLIDNGHGIGCVNGSPDGSLKEWTWTREVAPQVVARLKEKGYDAELLTPEKQDISINTRVARVNRFCARLGADNVIVISIHADAKGTGKKWHNDAYGWSCLVADTASAKSRKLANCLFDAAAAEGRHMRQPNDWIKYWERDNVGILTRTKCPAVLTESGFMTHINESVWLKSKEGIKTCVGIHVNGIIQYLEAL